MSETRKTIMGFDIEASGLAANFGFIHCVGYKTFGTKKTFVPSILDYDGDLLTREKKLLKKVYYDLTQADYWVSWYGQRYDVPFINSRLLFHDLPTLPPMGNNHIDGWRIAKYQLKMSSNRLATVSDFLGCGDKTPVSGQHWFRAMLGEKKSYKYIIKHCKIDVEVLEEVYNKLKGLVNTVNLTTKQDGRQCPRCNNGTVTKQGKRYTITGKITQQYKCKSCHGWSKAPIITRKNKETKKMEEVEGVLR